MKLNRSLIAVLLVMCLLVPTALSTAQGPVDFVARIDTEDVMTHVRALSVAIGARPASSEAETRAAAYIAAALQDWGYDVAVETFDLTLDGEPVQSRNVIATLPGDDQLVIVGAHMDSVTDATGAGDNASGVAAILAAAEAMAGMDLTHTLVFVAFGAEEVGLVGSDAYVEALGDDIGNVIAMINVDSVGVGTNLNVYAGAEITWPESDDDAPTIDGGPTWVRDLSLSLAEDMGLPFTTSPDDSWGGFTGDWSDHYAFVLAGVPVVYFEAWQWTGAEDPWWGEETAEGDVMHTPGDVYENVVPEKVEMAAELIAATAYQVASGEAVPG